MVTPQEGPPVTGTGTRSYCTTTVHFAETNVMCQEIAPNGDSNPGLALIYHLVRNWNR